MTNTTATRSLQLLLRLDCHPVPVGPVAIIRDEQCRQKTPAVFEVEGENLPQGNLCLKSNANQVKEGSSGSRYDAYTVFGDTLGMLVQESKLQ